MSEHALFSPSAAHRWSVCAASIKAAAAYEDTSSSHALVGTGIHGFAAEMLSASMRGDPPITVETCEGTLCPETGLMRTREWFDIACNYCLYVLNLRAPDHETHVEIEARVDHSSIVQVPNQAGTADFILADMTELELHVADLKTGKGVMVGAQDNEQLLIYGMAALLEYEGIFGVEFRRLVLHIVQPPLDHYDRWVIEFPDAKVVELLQRFRDKAQEALSDNPSFTPSDKGCRWCPHKPNCQALQDFVAEQCTDAVAPSSPSDFADITTPDETTPAGRLAQLLTHVGLVETWCKSVRAEAERRLLSGEPLPGYKLVQGRAKPRAWTDEAQAEEIMSTANRVAKAVRYTAKLISPTQAEKAYRSGDIGPKTWKLLQEVITRGEGGVSVAPETDPRPPYDPAAKPEDFENVAENDEVSK